MSALLGLDFGEKRIGVAVSDESATIANPLTVLSFQSRKQILNELTKLVEEYKISKIVVGLPKTLQGEIGPAAQKVIGHVEWFRNYLAPPWVFWDERLTTAEVERMLIDADVSRARRKEVRDQLAAQRILQSYLDSERREGAK